MSVSLSALMENARCSGTGNRASDFICQLWTAYRPLPTRRLETASGGSQSGQSSCFCSQNERPPRMEKVTRANLRPATNRPGSENFAAGPHGHRPPGRTPPARRGGSHRLRVVQRAHAGRTAQRRNLLHAEGGTGGHRAMETALQHEATAQRAGLSATRTRGRDGKWSDGRLDSLNIWTG